MPNDNIWTNFLFSSSSCERAFPFWEHDGGWEHWGRWDWLWLFQSPQILVRLQQRTDQTNKLKWANQTMQLKWANQTRQLKWANQKRELMWANRTNWLNWAKHPANFTRLTELEKANSSWANQSVLLGWKLPSIGPTSKIFFNINKLFNQFTIARSIENVTSSSIMQLLGDMVTTCKSYVWYFNITIIILGMDEIS